jgi:hypothetical protein
VSEGSGERAPTEQVVARRVGEPLPVTFVTNKGPFAPTLKIRAAQEPILRLLNLQLQRQRESVFQST